MKKIHLVLGSIQKDRLSYSLKNGYQPILFNSDRNVSTDVKNEKKSFLTLEDSISKEKEVYINAADINNNKYNQIIHICELYQAELNVHFLMNSNSFETEEENEKVLENILEIHRDKIIFVFFQGNQNTYYN